MMLDADIVAVSPATVYRVLSKADLLGRKTTKTKTKGKGFHQPDAPHWEIREKMEEQDIETILQRAKEKHPGVTPRIITDNGPQFISNDFKQFIRISGMTHVRTSPYYPQSNGKIERYHRTIKSDCIRPLTPLSLEEARRVVTDFVTTYNNERLHSAIGYVTPADKMAGRAKAIHDERDRKLAEARERRGAARQQSRRDIPVTYNEDARLEDKALLRSGHRPKVGPSATSGAETETRAAIV